MGTLPAPRAGPPRTARVAARKRILEQTEFERDRPLTKRPFAEHSAPPQLPAGCPKFTLTECNVYNKKLSLALDQFHPAKNACEQNARANIECEACSEKHCPNMKLQKTHMFPECQVLETKERGFGYFAGNKSIPKGTAIGPYTGEVFEASQLTDFKKQVYIMQIADKLFVNAKHVGFWTRFINHDCNPNCEVQKWHVCGFPCAGIFALRDIAPGEELTFDYGVKFGDTKAFVCMCPTCKPLAAAASLT